MVYGVLLGLRFNHSICTGVHGVGLDPREKRSRTTWLVSFVIWAGALRRGIAQKELLYHHRFTVDDLTIVGESSQDQAHATTTSIEYHTRIERKDSKPTAFSSLIICQL